MIGVLAGLLGPKGRNETGQVAMSEGSGVGLGWGEAVLIGSLLVCGGSLPGGALAEDSTGAETRVVADYRIDLDNFNLGSFRFTTTLNGSDYRVRVPVTSQSWAVSFMTCGPLQ